MNYEISRTVSRIVEPTGTIKKLSVAVLVDGIYEAAKTGGRGKTGRPRPKKVCGTRSEEEMKRIEEIVKKAMGYSPNGRIKSRWSTSSSASDRKNQPAPPSKRLRMRPRCWMPYVRYAVGGVLFFLDPVLGRPTADGDAGGTSSPAST